jgi:hypothetical protein
MWFSANLLFVSEHVERPSADPLWEEQILLIEAEHETLAFERAEAFGKSKAHEYRNQEGDLVRWTFRQVERVYPIDSPSLQNGTELFCRFLRNSEVQSLLVPFAD